MQVLGKREIREKTRRPAASSVVVRHVVRELAVLSSGEEAMQFTCSENWDMAMAMVHPTAKLCACCLHPVQDLHAMRVFLSPPGLHSVSLPRLLKVRNVLNYETVFTQALYCPALFPTADRIFLHAMRVFLSPPGLHRVSLPRLLKVRNVLNYAKPIFLHSERVFLSPPGLHRESLPRLLKVRNVLNYAKPQDLHAMRVFLSPPGLHRESLPRLLKVRNVLNFGETVFT
ncbi:hypothetical protein PR048_024124 [Dryococelus australis]|uniref:Uncharacterized protein n=1 Tax=Dryococelus australis TaxID=614101 RepID=A0ABQ9GW09_9NEOP|nr:hypothetical protein PR048_024124 [Dryococelus australis]